MLKQIAQWLNRLWNSFGAGTKRNLYTPPHYNPKISSDIDWLDSAKSIYPILYGSKPKPGQIATLKLIGFNGPGLSHLANDHLLAYIRQFEPEYPE